MSRRMPMAPITLPSGSRSAEALSVVGMTSPLALRGRSEEHTSELQSLAYLVCRLLLEKKKNASHRRRQFRNHNPADRYRPICTYMTVGASPCTDGTPISRAGRGHVHSCPIGDRESARH